MPAPLPVQSRALHRLDLRFDSRVLRAQQRFALDAIGRLVNELLNGQLPVAHSPWSRMVFARLEDELALAASNRLMATGDSARAIRSFPALVFSSPEDIDQPEKTRCLSLGHDLRNQQGIGCRVCLFAVIDCTARIC